VGSIIAKDYVTAAMNVDNVLLLAGKRVNLGMFFFFKSRNENGSSKTQTFPFPFFFQ